MNCLQAEEHFSAYFEDELDYQTLKGFEFHLSECERCEHEYTVFEKSVKATQELPQVTPSARFELTLHQQLAREHVLRQETVPLWKRLLSACGRPRWAFSGITLLILAAVGTYLYQKDVLDWTQNSPVVQIDQSDEEVQQSIEPIRLPFPPIPRSFSGTSISGSMSTEPMQQHYILKRVNYASLPTAGGL